MAKRKQLQLIENPEQTKANHDHSAEGKNFSTHHLVTFQPKTFPQQQFFDSFNAGIPVIEMVGSAGTGKTACALYAALHAVLDKSTVYDKIVLVRSAVQARDIGFLKGSEEEKNEVYEGPYVSLCDELLTFKWKNYENLKKKGIIEFHNTSFLRGKTFNNAIIIMDESQNATYHELSTVITRCGINSRIIFCGDYIQSDLHKKNDKSGFHQFLNVLQRMPSGSVDIINFTPKDNVRGGVSKEFLVAEEEFLEEDAK